MSDEKMPVKEVSDELYVQVIFADGVNLRVKKHLPTLHQDMSVDVTWQQLAHVCAEIFADPGFVYGMEFLDIIVRKQMEALKKALGE